MFLRYNLLVDDGDGQNGRHPVTGRRNIVKSDVIHIPVAPIKRIRDMFTIRSDSIADGGWPFCVPGYIVV